MAIVYELTPCSLSRVLKACVEKDVMIAAFEGVVDSGLIARIWDTEADDEANAEAFDMYLVRECKTRLRKFYANSRDIKDNGAHAVWTTTRKSSLRIDRQPALAFVSMHEFRKLGVKILLNLNEEDDKYGMYPRDIGGDGDDMELFGRHVVLNVQELDAHNDRRIVGYAPTSFDGKFYRVQAQLDGDVRHDPLSMQNAPQPARIADDDYGVPVGTSTPHARTGFEDLAAGREQPAAEGGRTNESTGSALADGYRSLSKEVDAARERLDRGMPVDAGSLLARLEDLEQQDNEVDDMYAQIASQPDQALQEESDADEASDADDERRVEYVNDNDDVLVDAVAAAVQACLVNAV